MKITAQTPLGHDITRSLDVCGCRADALLDNEPTLHALGISSSTAQPAAGRPGMHAGMWVVAIWYNFRLLLSLLPSPHFLQVLHQIPWVRRRLGMDLHHVTIWFDLAVAGMTVALGYGLLRMREWARWCYAGVCVFAIVSLGGVQFGLFLWPLNLMGGFILPVALLIFLFRRGLSAAPRGGSPSPVPSAGYSQ